VTVTLVALTGSALAATGQPDPLDPLSPDSPAVVDDQHALSGPPMSIEAARAIPSARCMPGGDTARDAAIARSLHGRMTGPRLGNLVNGYNISCARAIVNTTKIRKLNKRAAVVAVTTAITESSLRNYTKAVDHDSLGLFQQRRPWGTAAQRTNPVYATNAFLNAMLRKLPNGRWNNGNIGPICQRVQVSAYPGAYQREVHDAQIIVGSLY
jgi:hypothetical protein